MAKQPARLTRVYLDQYDLSGVLNATSLDVDQKAPEVTAFSDAGPRRVVDTHDVMHADMGLFDAAGGAVSVDAVVAALLGGTASHYLTKCFGGGGEGDVAFDSVVALTKQPRSVKLGNAVLLGFDSAGGDGVVRGSVLGAGTFTSAQNRAGINMGATTAGKVFAVIFRLLAFTGTNITLKLQESQNDGGADPYADIAGLTSGALTGIGAVRATTAAATEAWKRLNIAGTFTSATILVSAGVVAGT